MSSEAPRELMISAEGLGKCYQLYDQPIHRMWQALTRGKLGKPAREFWALRDVDLQIFRGETIGIIGRNGSGKSTLLQLIAGTLRATQGSLQRSGKIAALLELGSGFNPEFSGRQNVYLYAAILGLDRAQIDARVDTIRDYAEIGDFFDQPVRNYSTGMVMRLAFSVVVHVDADVLIIDEALAVGDAFFMQKCMRFLRAFREHGTLLFVSHDGSAVTSLCDRVYWLEQGRVQMQGEARVVMAGYVEASMAAIPGYHGSLQAAPARRDPPRKVMRERQDLIDRSHLRSDINVFPFAPQFGAIGKQDARVTDVTLADQDGPAVQFTAGQQLDLVVTVVAEAAINQLVVGFYVKDRLGQLLFGDNTFLYAENTAMDAGEVLEVRFSFELPRLLNGEYFVTVGVAEGTQDEHVMQHWLHEAIKFIASGGSLTSALVGFPMLDVRIERLGHVD